MTIGLVQTPQWVCNLYRRTPVLVPSSNSVLPVAWITAPATDARQYAKGYILAILIRYGEFYYVEIVIEFSNLLYGDFSQWFGFSNPYKWPTCMDWKIQATGSLINILQLFLFPDLNIFFKWTHKSNKSLRLKLSFNFQRSVIHSRIKRSHCT